MICSIFLPSSLSITWYSKQIAYSPKTSSLRSEHRPSQSRPTRSSMRLDASDEFASNLLNFLHSLAIFYYFTLTSFSSATLVYCFSVYISDVARPYTSAHSLKQLSEQLQGLYVVVVPARLPSSHSLHYIISTMNPQDQFTARLLSNNLRPDGREPLQQRLRQVLFMPSRGHLIFQQGGSQVTIKTKVEITAPKNERPSEGNVFFRVDCTSCNGSNEEQRKLANEAAKLLETAVVGSKALDPESLCILSGRYVWRVAIECLVNSDDGNILDCLLNATVLSLMDVRKPLVKFQKQKLVVEEEIHQGLSLAHIPVSLTLALTDNNLIADPIGWQERVSKSRITVTMNVYKELCSIHKPGGMGITQQTLSGCVRLAEQRVKGTTEWMRNMISQRPLFDSAF